MSDTDLVLNERIRAGVEALAESHGQAEVIAQDDEEPYVFVDIGEVDLDGYDYDQEEARVILRVHKDFPRSRHYGLVTIPILTVDGRDPDHTTRNHDHAECLRQSGIEENYLYWSRDWQELTVSDAKEMTKAIAFVHGTLRNPFENE